jgi:hypothetical protein
MSELDKFQELFTRKVESAKQAQLRFVTCKSVNWDEKTMTATGVSDDVDYEGVQLGFGYVDVKPAIGTVCLIGILEGQESMTFLINAENVELVELSVNNTITINGGTLDGLVIVNALVEKINRLEDKLKNHQHVYLAYPSTPTLTTPASALVPPDSTLVFDNTKKEDIENEKIKQ